MTQDPTTRPCSGIVEGFFQDLFDPYGTDGGQIEVRAIRPKWKNSGRKVLRALTSSVDRAARWAENIIQEQLEYDLYFGVLPRVDGRTTKDGIKSSAVLWVDIDCKVPGHRSRAYMQLQDDLMPSYIIDSGRGLHAYWLLNEVIVNVAQVEAVNKALACHFNADLSCYDRTRVLRVPSSLNFKDKKNPVEVRILKRTPVRYPLESIVSDLNHRLGVKVPEVGADHADRPASMLSFNVKETPVSNERIQFKFTDWQKEYLFKGIHGDHKEIYGGDRSRLDYYFVRWCGTLGFGAGEIAWMLTNPEFGISAKTLGFESDRERDRYLTRTIQRAFKDIGKELDDAGTGD